MNVFELSAAYIADWILGDPINYPHPVKLIGKAIQFLEKKLFYKGNSPPIQRLLGGILLISITLMSGTSTWAIIRLFEWIHPTLSSIATIFFAYTTLATRNLYDEVKSN